MSRRRQCVHCQSRRRRQPTPSQQREYTSKRSKNPSPPLTDTDCDSDIEFQAALAKQKRKVNREVAILKEMGEQDERAQARRQEKRKKLDHSIVYMWSNQGRKTQRRVESRLRSLHLSELGKNSKVSRRLYREGGICPTPPGRSFRP